eukprot:scaffold262122_cov28-Tisochrysis_lutea.AAC.2
MRIHSSSTRSGSKKRLRSEKERMRGRSFPARKYRKKRFPTGLRLSAQAARCLRRPGEEGSPLNRPRTFLSSGASGEMKRSGGGEQSETPTMALLPASRHISRATGRSPPWTTSTTGRPILRRW